jgi:hypothetical protein
MRFRPKDGSGCGCCNPWEDLNARIDTVNTTALAAMSAANTAIGIANAQAAAAAASAAAAAADAQDAADDAADALTQAQAAAASLAQIENSIVSAWQATPDDDHIPSEKLVKDSLDAKMDDSQIVVTWQPTPDNSHVPSEALTKNSLDAKVDDSQIVTSFQATPDNDHIPTEKLVKDSLDDKVDDSQVVTAWQVTPDNDHIASEKLTKDSLDGKTSPQDVTDALDSYAPMMRTTGDQVIDGYKRFVSAIPGDISGVLISRELGYYRTYNLGPPPTTGSWFINVMFSWRYGLTFNHIEVSFDANGVTSFSSTKLINPETGNTKVAIDIIDGEAYLVVNRVSQSNVYSRITLLFLQKGANNAPAWTRPENATKYTPAGTLIEGNLI